MNYHDRRLYNEVRSHNAHLRYLLSKRQMQAPEMENVLPSEVILTVDGEETTLQDFLHVNTDPSVGEIDVAELLRVCNLQPGEECVVGQFVNVARVK